MHKVDVFRHFGGAIKTAAALGLTKSAVYQWGDTVPEKQAYRIERLTMGVLRVDLGAYQKLPVVLTIS